MNALKKTLIALFLAVSTFGVANAQFRFGVKAGVNVNHISTNINDLKNNQAGWTAGVMTEFQVPVIGIGFDLSLMYARLNSDVLVDLSDGTTEKITNRNFIMIPLNVKYKLKLPVVGNFIAPYIFTGPDFAFKLDKNTVKDFRTKTCQVAWNVGLGLELVKHLQVGASYGFGINKIAKNWVNSTNDDIKNNYWTITAAYLF